MRSCEESQAASKSLQRDQGNSTTLEFAAKISHLFTLLYTHPQKQKQKASKTYMRSSLMEIPPSFNMGVTSSARYNQMWGISMAMSSANSNVSEKLKRTREKVTQM